MECWIYRYDPPCVGPKKLPRSACRYGPVTGFDLLAKTGAAYEARKNDPAGAWKKAAYEDGPEQQAAAVSA